MAYVVRYGRMRFLGEYGGPGDEGHRRGERVVIRSDRGTELGEVLCASSSRTSGFLEQTTTGAILRTASVEDLEHEASLVKSQKDAFRICQEFIARRRLQMDLVDVEIIFGRERIVFYYLAAKRVDFRELVKDLARALHVRIEMRQIGVRDEAKLLADYGDCGKPVCCNTHLTAMPPVSMKMAKLQKTTLDPAKISGRCGRLKCCLRYEFDTYRTLERDLPPVGSVVTTSQGQGRVVAQEILAQKLVVEYEDRRRIIIGREEIQAAEPPRARPAQSRQRTGPGSNGATVPQPGRAVEPEPGGESPAGGEYEANGRLDGDSQFDDMNELGPGEEIA
jgi:cell fate regulator YaaT (PSP1 superfamily)